MIREDTLLTLSSVDKTGDKAVPVLVKALKDPDDLVRREALYGLLIFRDKVEPHIGEVITLLKDNKDKNKLQILDFLSVMGPKSKDAIPEIIELTKDKAIRMRLKAVRTLGAIAEPTPAVLDALRHATSDQEEKVRKQASLSLQRLEEKDPNRALPTILSGLKQENANKAELLESVIGLGPKAKVAAPEVSKLTSDRQAVVRLKAVQALGAMGLSNDAIVKTLEQALHDNELGVRRQAVLALERVGEKDENKVAPILIEALRNEKDSLIKNQITVSLKRLAHQPAPGLDKTFKKGSAVR